MKQTYKHKQEETKMRKKTVASVLALMLILTSIPFSGFSASAAEGESDTQLPSSIDLRNYNSKNYVTPVKLQSPFGTCWAFSLAAAAETAYLYANDMGVPAGKVNNTVDFSEKYIAWYLYHSITEDDVTTGRVRASQISEGFDSSDAESKNSTAVYGFGGEFVHFSGFFAADFGPVDESVSVNGDTPYYYSGKNRRRTQGLVGYSAADDWSLPLNSEYRNAPSDAVFRSSKNLPSPASKNADGSYKFNQSGVDAIKSEIAQGHGVALAFYSAGNHYNNKTWAWYNYASYLSDHAVTVVGYDDNYSKDNFTRVSKSGKTIKNSTPPGDGAFIVKNSWGALTDEDRATAKTDKYGKVTYENPNATPWGIDDSGFFYLSYYDQTIVSPISFTFDNSADSPSSRNCDQYDLLMTGVYSNNDYIAEAKTANVFDAEEDEYLYQISYRTNTDNTTVHYEIYKNPEADNPSSGTLLEKGDTLHAYMGYYRIDLNGEYFLRKGERYSIVLTMTHKDSSGAEVYTDTVPYAANIHPKNSPKPNGVINKGESFLYADGKWSDMSELKSSLIDSVYQYCSDTDDLDHVLISRNPEGKENFVVDNYPIKGLLIPAKAHDAGVLLGDSDGSGEVEIKDATQTQQFLAEMSVNSFCENAADVNRDGKVNIDDVTITQRYLAEMTAPEGIGKVIYT